MKRFLIITLFIILTINSTWAMDYKSKTIDCFFLFKNIDKAEIFKGLSISYYYTKNEGTYRKKFINKDVELLKIMTKCIDKIFEVNKSDYNYRDKIRYYFYRTLITSGYSEDDTTLYYKKYMYLSYKIKDAQTQNMNSLKIKFPYDVDRREYIEGKLTQKCNLNRNTTLKQLIMEDKQLQSDSDLNTNLF